MPNTWSAPSKGWPSFDKNGKRIKENNEEEDLSTISDKVAEVDLRVLEGHGE